jgi:hypothetical protein
MLIVLNMLSVSELRRLGEAQKLDIESNLTMNEDSTSNKQTRSRKGIANTRARSQNTRLGKFNANQGRVPWEKWD